MNNHTSGTVTERIRQWVHLCEQSNATGEATEIMELALEENKRLREALKSCQETVENHPWGWDGDCGIGMCIDYIVDAALEGGDDEYRSQPAFIFNARLQALVAEFDGRISTAAAIDAFEVVKHELIADALEGGDD